MGFNSGFKGLIRTAIHPAMQKIRINGFFFENRLHWQFEIRLLPFTICKAKAIPLQAWTGPEGSRRLRLPDFKNIGT